MEENAFWLGVWKIVGSLACVTVLSTASCTAHQTYVLNQAIEKGVDPIKAHCSVYGSSDHDQAMCALAVTSQK